MALVWLALWGTTDARATDIGVDRTLGLGVQLGTATGVSGRAYLGGRRWALGFGAGFASRQVAYDAFFGEASLHYGFAPLAEGDGVTVPLRVGLGAFATTRGETGATTFGVRLPVGVDLDLERVPFQFSLEVSPATLSLSPAVSYGLDASFAVRYYL